MKTEVMIHCGNAPKMERVIELTIALAKVKSKIVCNFLGSVTNLCEAA